MQMTKQMIVDPWQVTNLGEPSKIIGIEITCRKNCISILLQKRAYGIHEPHCDAIRSECQY